jgi:hypothetical protein
VIQKPAIPVEFLLFLSDWEVREDIWRGTVSFDAEDKHFKTRTILVPESVEVQALRSSNDGVPGVPFWSSSKSSRSSWSSWSSMEFFQNPDFKELSTNHNPLFA